MKKTLAIIAAVVCVVAIAACGTLAYFTASKTATNTFMTAKYNPEDPGPVPPQELFSIKVEETNTTGTGTNTTGNTYEKVLPGTKVTKDPKITNTGAYDQWVRVLVTFDNVAAWDKAGVKMADLFSTLVTKGFVKENWNVVAPAAAKEDKATFTCYYVKNGGKLAPKASTTLFTEVTIPTSLTVEQFSALSCFHISIEAQAIQADNNGATPQAGFTNWK